MRIAYIVPGGDHSPRRPEYRAVGDLFAHQGFTPCFVNVDWTKKSFPRQTNDVIRSIKPTPHQAYLFGFSMGAVLALRASTHLRIDGQILCSLSSAFTEDVPAIEQGGVPLEEDKELAPYARMIRKNSFREVVANNITPTFALVGDKEYPPLIQRVRALASSLPNAHLKVIPDTGHDISSPQYLAAIDDAIRKLGQ